MRAFCEQDGQTYESSTGVYTKDANIGIRKPGWHRKLAEQAIRGIHEAGQLDQTRLCESDGGARMYAQRPKSMQRNF